MPAAFFSPASAAVLLELLEFTLFATVWSGNATLGLHVAHSMEQLVASNSYPYLELGRSTHILPGPGVQSDMRRKIEYELINDGIGPARVEWVQFTYKDKPVQDLKEPATPSPTFDAMHGAMDDFDFSACYCSVFDECYIRKNDGSKPQPVEQCTPPAVSFQPTFSRRQAP